MSSVQSDLETPLITGSIVVNDYVRRKVKVLAIYEHEADQISFMNGLGTLCFSLMSAFFSFAIGTWVNAAFQNELTPAATILAKVVGPGAVALGIVAGVLGRIALSKRGSTLRDIKSQSSIE
ncbi:hypothetical protein ACMFL9_26635 [Sinorhizobium meliloti]